MNTTVGQRGQDVTHGRRRGAALAAGALVALYAVSVGLVLWIDLQVYAVHAPPGTGGWGWIVERGLVVGPFVLFAVVGAVIVSRRPRNVVGWLLLVAASAVGLAGLAVASALLTIGGSPADPPVLGLVAKWFELPAITLASVLALVLVPLLFPNGRLPSRRWRPAVWGAVAVVALAVVESVFSPRLADSIHPLSDGSIQVYDVANPLAVPWMQPLVAASEQPARALTLAALSVVAAAAVVVRFRRSRGVERQQMKWFVFAAGLVGVMHSSLAVFFAVFDGAPTWMWVIAILGAFGAYPLAVGVAVLRYRLYEIDRLISRTVAYGLVVAVLAGVYVAGVVGLGAAVMAVTGQGGSDVVVAVSTLAVAALFRPVRARIQSAVDRRFNRTGYEARAAVGAFAHEVRDEVDMAAIRRKVAETAAVAVQPTQISVWLADGGEERL